MKIFDSVFKTRGVDERESEKMVLMSFLAIKTLMNLKSLGINEN